jgi:hypothetical protein
MQYSGYPMALLLLLLLMMMMMMMESTVTPIYSLPLFPLHHSLSLSVSLFTIISPVVSASTAPVGSLLMSFAVRDRQTDRQTDGVAGRSSVTTHVTVTAPCNITRTCNAYITSVSVTLIYINSHNSSTKKSCCLSLSLSLSLFGNPHISLYFVV